MLKEFLELTELREFMLRFERDLWRFFVDFLELVDFRDFVDFMDFTEFRKEFSIFYFYLYFYFWTVGRFCSGIIDFFIR